jgi:hypothetical protein
MHRPESVTAHGTSSLPLPFAPAPHLPGHLNAAAPAIINRQLVAERIANEHLN